MMSLSCHQSHVWINYIGDIMTAHVAAPSMSLALVSKMYDIHKSTSPGEIQLKSLRKPINIEEKLNVINQHEKSEQVVDVCRNVRLAHSSLSTIRDNTYLLTPWSRILLEKLTSFQLIKKFPAFYGT